MGSSVRPCTAVRDECPTVETIYIHLEFSDYDGLSPPSPQELKLSSACRAFYKYPCPSSECVSGGFIFRSEVLDAVNKRLTEKSGLVLCHGWQDRERINKNKCLLECKYRISIAYKSGHLG